MRSRCNDVAAVLADAALTVRRWFGLQILMAGLLALFLAAPARSEEKVYVQQDGTALLTAPSDDANVEWTLNRGRELIVLDHQGEWLKVRSQQFMSVGVDLWVRASQVGPKPKPKSVVVAPPAAALEVEPTSSSFRLEVDGTPTIKFRAVCRVVGATGETYQRYDASIPQVIDFVGSAVSCTARKLDTDGRLSLSLISRDGQRIGSIETSRPYNWVLVQSDGPWGEAGTGRGLTRMAAPSGLE